MRHIAKKISFIDLGAFNGDTVDLALQTIPNINEVYAFEPLSSPFRDMEKRFRDRIGFTFINAAAELVEGESKIYLGNEYGDIASSLYADNRNCYQDKWEVIDTVDFPKFLGATFGDRANKYIVLKMNIEGSEYPFLEKMIEDGSIGLVDRIFCDWHWYAVGVSEYDHHSLVRRLRKLGFDLCGGKLDELHNATRYNSTVLKLKKFSEYFIRSSKLSTKTNFPGFFNWAKMANSRILGKY